jgi:energy-coupling factor transporter transmembrane protein EcfT
VRPVTAVGPLALLAGCLLPVPGALAIQTTRLGLIVIALQLLAFGWLLGDPRGAARRLLFGLVAGVSVGATTWLYGGHHLDESAGAFLRVLAIVLPGAILTPLIRPSQLGDHLAQRLRLPARFVVGAVAALQRLDTIGQQWTQVQRARRTRGLGVDGRPTRRLRSSAGAAFALLVLAMRQASATAVAMDVRGFGAAHERTWAQPAAWHRGDSIVLMSALVLGVAPWVLR